VTKDIDLVCRDAAGKARLLEAAKSLGFEVFGPEKRHVRLGLDRVAIKGGHTLDIFSLKLIANRPLDIEDCISLASAKMDFEAIYSEILAQYTKAGTVEEKIWITYLEEGIGKLEEDYRLQVTIADRVSELANEYRERLYQKLISHLDLVE
jgi:hypothetical protein